MPAAIPIAALAVSAGSAAMQAKSASDAAGATQDAVNRQTQISHDQYGRRAAITDANFADLLANEQKQFDVQQSTAKGTTDQQHALTIAGNAERAQAANEQTARDLGTNLENLTGQEGISRDAFNKQQAARADFASLVARELAAQAGYRGQADSAVDSTVGTMGEPAMEAGRVADAAAKNATAQSTIDGPALTPGFENVSALAKQTALADMASRIDPVRAAATAGSNVASYGNMLTTAGIRQGSLADALRTIATESETSHAALPSALAPSEVGFSNAGSLANALSAALASQEGGKLKLSGMIAKGIIDPSAAFQQSEVGSVGDLGNKLIQASADYEKARNDSGNSMQNAINTSSLGFENTMKGINNFQIQTANQPSVFGNAAGSLGSALGRLDPQKTWDTLQGWFTTTAPTVPTVPSVPAEAAPVDTSGGV